MAKAESQRRHFARLSFTDGEVVVTPKDRDIFFISAERATEACRKEMHQAERIKQFESQFLYPLHDWCVAHAHRVRACYIPLPGSQIPVFVVTNSKEFDFDLAAEVAGLELKLVQSGWRVGVSQLPDSEEDTLATFFSKEGALEVYARADQHRIKAESNRNFLNSISLDDYPDWVVVAVFYTAVHLVERVRSLSGHGDSTSHEDRLAYVQEVHAVIHTPYHVLQNASMLARYQSNATFFGQFQREAITERLIGKHLREIETYVEAFRKPAG